jgi:hypothetical protein
MDGSEVEQWSKAAEVALITIAEFRNRVEKRREDRLPLGLRADGTVDVRPPEPA